MSKLRSNASLKAVAEHAIDKSRRAYRRWYIFDEQTKDLPWHKQSSRQYTSHDHFLVWQAFKDIAQALCRHAEIEYPEFTAPKNSNYMLPL